MKQNNFPCTHVQFIGLTFSVVSSKQRNVSQTPKPSPSLPAPTVNGK